MTPESPPKASRRLMKAGIKTNAVSSGILEDETVDFIRLEKGLPVVRKGNVIGH